MTDLPDGWVESTFGELCELKLGKMLDRAKNKGELTRYLRNINVRWGEFDLADVSEMRMSADERQELSIRDGDIIVCEGGEPGRCAVWSRGANDFAFQKALIRARPREGVSSPLLSLALRHLAQTGELASYFTGTTIKHLPQAALSRVPVHVPPLPEQRRIVEKLDKLMARTARAKREFDRVPALIAKYKKAILSAAFSGELTREWREHNSSGRSIAEVLQSVRDTRSTVSKLSRRKSCTEIPALEIPSTWRWISPDELAADSDYSIGIGPFGSNLLKSDYQNSGVRLVFVRDIRSGDFRHGDARFVSREKAATLHQHVVTGGDLLITKMGDPPGDAAIYPKQLEPAVITADCVKWTPHPGLASAQYLLRAVQSEFVKQQIQEITKGVAHQKMSLERFRTVAIPVAPIEEQKQVCLLVERAITWLENIATEYGCAQCLLPRLDQALLAKAFRGELVPQDPNEEPAAVLLERIKAARSQQAQTQPKRGRKASAPKSPREKAVMTKSRQDEDVKNKPYLADIIRQSGGTSMVEDLFKKADLPVTDFYKQLAWEVDKGHIRDQNNQTLQAA